MSLTILFLLCIFAFIAGFVDAIVGGGGLIQTPASLILLSQFPVARVIGTVKIPACTGTFFATIQYMRRVRLRLALALVMCVTAFCSAFAGSEVLTLVSNRFMKPVIFLVLIGVAMYTYRKKNFGQHAHKTHSRAREMVYGMLVSVVIGFYDGFIGPGAGSFLMLAFISILGFDFLHASAHAKLVNLCTNTGSILLFLLKGAIFWRIAIPMAICNGLGGALGAKLAISKGNRFIRHFFLAVVVIMLLRFGYDIWVNSFSSQQST